MKKTSLSRLIMILMISLSISQPQYLALSECEESWTDKVKVYFDLQEDKCIKLAKEVLKVRAKHFFDRYEQALERLETRIYSREDTLKQRIDKHKLQVQEIATKKLRLQIKKDSFHNSQNTKTYRSSATKEKNDAINKILTAALNDIHVKFSELDALQSHNKMVDEADLIQQTIDTRWSKKWLKSGISNWNDEFMKVSEFYDKHHYKIDKSVSNLQEKSDAQHAEVAYAIESMEGTGKFYISDSCLEIITENLRHDMMTRNLAESDADLMKNIKGGEAWVEQMAELCQETKGHVKRNRDIIDILNDFYHYLDYNKHKIAQDQKELSAEREILDVIKNYIKLDKILKDKILTEENFWKHFDLGNKNQRLAILPKLTLENLEKSTFKNEQEEYLRKKLAEEKRVNIQDVIKDMLENRYKKYSTYHKLDLEHIENNDKTFITDNLNDLDGPIDGELSDKRLFEMFIYKNVLYFLQEGDLMPDKYKNINQQDFKLILQDIVRNWVSHVTRNMTDEEASEWIHREVDIINALDLVDSKYRCKDLIDSMFQTWDNEYFENIRKKEGEQAYIDEVDFDRRWKMIMKYYNK